MWNICKGKAKLNDFFVAQQMPKMGPSKNLDNLLNRQGKNPQESRRPNLRYNALHYLTQYIR